MLNYFGSSIFLNMSSLSISRRKDHTLFVPNQQSVFVTEKSTFLYFVASSLLKMYFFIKITNISNVSYLCMWNVFKAQQSRKLPMDTVDSTKVTLVPVFAPTMASIGPLSVAHRFLPNGFLQFRMKATLSSVNHFPLSKLQDATLGAACRFRESWYLSPAAQSNSLRGHAASFYSGSKTPWLQSSVCVLSFSSLECRFQKYSFSLLLLLVAVSKGVGDHKIIYRMTWEFPPL